MQQSDPEFDENDPFQAELLRKLEAARSERTEVELWDPALEEEMMKQAMTLREALTEANTENSDLRRQNVASQKEIASLRGEISSLRGSLHLLCEELRREHIEKGKSVASQCLSFLLLNGSDIYPPLRCLFRRSTQHLPFGCFGRPSSLLAFSCSR